MNQTVLLIGGVSGVGKSTLASGIKHLYGEDCFNFDFGTAYERPGGRIAGPERIDDWEEQITHAISNGLTEGYGLVVANSKFMQKSRRDFILDYIGEKARTIPLVLRPPLLDVFHQLREGRPAERHTVNRDNAREALSSLCARSIDDDQSDILLPSDKAMLSREYLAILNRSELNRPLLNQNGTDPRVRWVTVPERITPHKCIDIVESGAEGAYEIRRVLEGQQSMLECMPRYMQV
jgi:hypothetical protein